MRRAVFLDRDGTINAMVYNAEFGLVDSPANAAELALLPGAAAAVRQINDLGLLAILVSNQPGIAKGKFTPELLDATTAALHAGLALAGARLDAVYYCLHHPDAALPAYRAQCTCRKPAPGLLERAAEEWDIDLAASYMIGDGIVDVLAGQAVAATTFLIAGRKCLVCDELARHDARPNYVVPALANAVEIIAGLEARQAVADAPGDMQRALPGNRAPAAEPCRSCTQ